jgi:hypothetical protein
MKNTLFACITLTALISCNSVNSEWTSLLSNDSLDGWHIFQDNGSKKGWIVEDGILTFNGISDMESGAGDASLLSDKTYKNFEIKFDWQIEAGGNSGFLWGVREDKKYKYPYQTGPEIQILDAATYDDPNSVLGPEIERQNVLEDLEERKHFVSAVYDLFPPSILDASKSAGEWNSYHITINYDANFGEVIFNGIKVNSFPLKGEEWDQKMKESKFSRSDEDEYLGDARWYDFAKFPEGHICLQDHPGKVSFRNIKIRELD